MMQPHTYFNNGIAESALLLIRKTTEFFKPKGDRDPPDTLYAYRYLDNWPGMWVIPKDIYIELHKRVGHITVVGSVRGRYSGSGFSQQTPFAGPVTGR